MDWANLGRPCLLVRPLTNQQFKEGLRIPYYFWSGCALFTIDRYRDYPALGCLNRISASVFLLNRDHKVQGPPRPYPPEKVCPRKKEPKKLALYPVFSAFAYLPTLSSLYYSSKTTTSPTTPSPPPP